MLERPPIGVCGAWGTGRNFGLSHFYAIVLTSPSLLISIVLIEVIH